MKIYNRGNVGLESESPECADCGRQCHPEAVAVVADHILCTHCADDLKACSPGEWRRRVGALSLKRLVPPSEIGSFDIRSDPAFVFASVEDVTRDHWEEMVKRLHGLARSIINRRTGTVNAKLASEIATKIIRGLIHGATSAHLRWSPEECPNLLRWLVDAMIEEVNILIPIQQAPKQTKRQPWQTIVLPVMKPDEQREHRGVDFQELRKLGIG